jgi:hypothetical protein
MSIMCLIDGKGGCRLVTQNIIHQHIAVTVSTKDESATLAAGNRSISRSINQDVIICLDRTKAGDFLVRTNVPQADSAVFAASGKGIVVRW